MTLFKATRPSAEWSSLNCLCKMKSWGWRIHLTKDLKFIFWELWVWDWCVGILPPLHLFQAQRQLVCTSFLFGQTSGLPGKKAAALWALHNLPASEKRGFPPTYFQQRIRDNDILPLESHLDFCVIFQGSLRDCPLKHKYGDKILK